MDTHLVGSLHLLHRRLDQLTEMLKALQDEVKELRQTGVSINFHVNSDEEADEESGEESEGGVESVNTWP
jgi:hypothetical protein